MNDQVFGDGIFGRLSFYKKGGCVGYSNWKSDEVYQWVNNWLASKVSWDDPGPKVQHEQEEVKRRGQEQRCREAHRTEILKEVWEETEKMKLGHDCNFVYLFLSKFI